MSNLHPMDNAHKPLILLLYLISNTAFANSSSGMNALLAAATNLVVSNPSKGLYTGEFTYTNPTPATNNYLYLIYDYIN